MDNAEYDELYEKLIICDDPVDLRGIARLLDVSKHTPNQWRQRDLLPRQDWPELLRPVWKTSTIIRWARDTGRWPPGETARSTTRSSPVNDADLTDDLSDAIVAQTFKTAEQRGAEIPPAIFRTAELAAAS